MTYWKQYTQTDQYEEFVVHNLFSIQRVCFSPVGGWIIAASDFVPATQGR